MFVGMAIGEKKKKITAATQNKLLNYLVLSANAKRIFLTI